MMPLLFAQFQVPTTAYVWIVGVVVTAVILFGVVLAAARSARSNLADELKREIAAQAQPAPVAVQQPLHVKEAIEFATREEHKELAKKVDAENAKHTSARKGIYEKLDAHGSRLTALESAGDTVVELKRNIDDNTKLTARIDGKVEQINQNVALLQTSLTQFLRDARK